MGWETSEIPMWILRSICCEYPLRIKYILFAWMATLRKTTIHTQSKQRQYSAKA